MKANTEAKLDDQLRDRLAAAAEAAAPQEIEVLVKLKPGTDAAALKASGLKNARTYSTIPYVSGTLSPAEVYELADQDAVERIEFGGEGMRALSTDPPAGPGAPKTQ